MDSERSNQLDRLRLCMESITVSIPVGVGLSHAWVTFQRWMMIERLHVVLTTGEVLVFAPFPVYNNIDNRSLCQHIRR